MTMPPVAPLTDGAFQPAQREYLQGFFAGLQSAGLFVGLTPAGQLTATAPDAVTGNLAAPRASAAVEPAVRGTPLSELSQPERWKHAEHPLDSWERLLSHATANQSPDAENNFRFRWFGLFHVAPAQDGFMLRLRIPGGEVSATQLHGLAAIARDHGGGYAHVTTRANLQIREIKPRSIVEVLTRIQDLGLTARGSGADNIRNITASPDSGLAADELIDVRPFAKALHHYILNHRDLYDLPRKFNVAFDSGSSLSAAADTNDLAFFAVRPADSVHFRVRLGGVTGHKAFARDTGLLIRPSEAVAVAAAMIRVFADHGDRVDRKKARFKYLLEKWGLERFLEETQKRLAFPLERAPMADGESRRPVEKHAWIGVRRQQHAGLNWIGVGMPVGRMSVKQMHGLADLAAHYGRGELRLTAWQNLLVPHVADAWVSTVVRSLHRLGFSTEPSPATDGVIACTGSRGCKYASADTKGSALALIKYLRGRLPELEQPVNIHFTGCSHSCAQHYCGDLGLIATKLADGNAGYHVTIGGGMDHEQGIGREIFRGVADGEVNGLVERMLRTYLARRESGETFVQWSRRHTTKSLQEFFS